MNGFYSDQHGYYTVRDMIALCVGRKSVLLPITSLAHNMGYHCWSDGTPHSIMMDRDPERFSGHKKRITEADLHYPIIVMEGELDIMDGMHRLCKCIQEGRPTIECFILSKLELRSIRRFC